MKKSIKKFFGSLVLFLIVGNAFSQELKYSGEIQTFWACTMPYTKEPGKLSAGDTIFTNELKGYLGDSSFYFKGDLSHSLLENKISLNIDELWIDYTKEFWAFKIGHQKVVWGKADGINITNEVFPQNISSIFSDDKTIAIDALKLNFSKNNFIGEFYVIPFFTASQLPLEESNIFRPYLLELPGNFTLDKINITNPDAEVSNWEYGTKLSAYFSLLDLSLYAFYGLDKMPLFSMNITSMTPPTFEINGEYKKILMFGFDAAIPIKSTVLRTEAAIFPQRYFAQDLQKTELKALVGLDWIQGSWTITAQYFNDYIFGDLDKLPENLKTDNYKHGSTINIQKSLLGETLDLELTGILELNDLDFVLKPEANYSLTDQLKIAGGSFICVPGTKNGTYGKYKELSSVFLKVSYKF